MKYSKGYFLMKMFYAISYNHDLFTLKLGVDEILDRLAQDKDIFRPDVWNDLDDVWSIIVFLYGDYGTSPRSGWIINNEHTYMIYHDMLVVAHELADMMEENKYE